MNFFENTAFIKTPPAQICRLPESYNSIKMKILNKKMTPGFSDSGLCDSVPTNPYMHVKTKMRILRRTYKNVLELYHQRMLLIEHLRNSGQSRRVDIAALFRSDFIQDMTTLEIRYYELILNETSPINSPIRTSISELDDIAIEHAQAEDRARRDEPAETGMYRLRRGVIYAHNTSGHPPSIDNLSETD